MQTVTLRETTVVEENEKLKKKLIRINQLIEAEELKAARMMNSNIDYWQARLSAMGYLKEEIRKL